MSEERYVEDLADKDDFSRWYLDVVHKAGNLPMIHRCAAA